MNDTTNQSVLQMNDCQIKFMDPLGIRYNLYNTVKDAYQQGNKIVFYAVISTVHMVNTALRTAEVLSGIVPKSTIFLKFTTYNEISISLRDDKDRVMCGIDIINQTIYAGGGVCEPSNPSCLGLSIEAYLRKDLYRRGTRGSKNRIYIRKTFDTSYTETTSRVIDALEWMFVKMYDYRLPPDELYNFCTDSSRFESTIEDLIEFINVMSVLASYCTNDIAANFQSFAEEFQYSMIFDNYIAALASSKEIWKEVGDELKACVFAYCNGNTPATKEPTDEDPQGQFS